MRAERWLKCEVLPGTFTNEVIVIVDEVTHGKTLAIVVNKALVRFDEALKAGHPVPGLVRVVTATTSAERADVILPTSSTEFGSTIGVATDRLFAVA